MEARSATRLLRPRVVAAPLALAALAAVAAIVVVVSGGASGQDLHGLAAGDKVRVTGGERAGSMGAIKAVYTGSGRPAEVRLTDGTVGRFAPDDLREQLPAVGDWVRAPDGAGRVKRVLGRGASGRFVVELADGSTPRLDGSELAFITTARAPAPFAQPSCEPDAIDATSAAAVRAALGAGRNVCVRTDVGDVDLSELTSRRVRYLGTNGEGELGFVDLSDSSGLVLRARFRSTEIRDSRSTTIENSVLGGTSERRVLDQLIFIPEDSDDVTIRDSDIGWTSADSSGNTGYGLRVYGRSDRLRVERNRFHHIGADGIQIGMDGADALIDRNEIEYVAPPPGSDEHADDIQVVGHGPNLRVTNNYLHDNGRLGEGGPTSGGSGPYIHAGDDDTLLFQNNLVRDEENFMQVGSLGTGGRVRSNLTFRRNTFFNNGAMFRGGADLSWRLSGGENNLYERNLVISSMWNEFGFGTHTTARDNLNGRYELDAQGDCTSAACNPAGQEPIGFRKPGNVRW